MSMIDTNISNIVLEKISNINFLNTFNQEYLNVFDKERKNRDCILCDRVTYFTADTIAWEKVLKNTCKITNNMEIYEYYIDLDVYIMEIFNDKIIKLLQERNLFITNYTLNKCEFCFLDY